MEDSAASFRIRVDADGRPVAEFDSRADERILFAHNEADLEAVPTGCRGGGCGTCRIRVLQGGYATMRMSRNWISEDEQLNGYALACRTLARSDLVIERAPLDDPHEIEFPV